MIKSNKLLVCLSALFFSFLMACGGKQNEASNTTKPEIDKSAMEETEEPASEEATMETPAEDVTDVVPQEQLDKAKEIIAEAKSMGSNGVDAEKLYKMHCASCHGFTGNMMVNGAKDLTKSTIDLVGAVAQVYHGKGLMTPYKGILKANEMVEVCKYVESLRK